MHSSDNHNKGFTLLEMIVAIAIFTVVAFMAISALLTTFNANTKAQSSRKLVDNVAFAFEDLVRNARIGMDYHCEATAPASNDDIGMTQDCSDGTFLAFEGSGG